MFNALQGWIEGAKVLDLFCGTGSLGIEALSRGAAQVVFVDNNSKSLSILRRNLEALDTPRESYRIAKQDVFQFLKDCEQTFDLIFIDPPFTEKLGDSVMQAVAQSSISHAQSRVHLESAKQEPVGKEYGSFFAYKQRVFGDKCLSVFHQKESP